MRAARASAILAVVCVMSGCGDSGSTSTGASDTAALRAVPWVLVGSTPSIEFGATQAQGSTGCNRFHGPYSVDGDAMKLGPLATTQMACIGEADQIERSFLAKLDKVRRWHATEKELVLSDSGGGELLRFEPGSLVGDWQVTSFHQGDAIKSTINDTHLTANFDDSGSLSGSAGCNQYHATYTSDRGAIQIGPPSAQQKECAQPPGIMEQEHAYLQALTEARRYELAGPQLTLLTEKGTIAVTLTKG
jgi:heat shock protein HslJ